MKLKNYALLALIALINLSPNKLLAEEPRVNQHACRDGKIWSALFQRCVTRKQYYDSAPLHYIELGPEYYLADR